MSEHSKAPDSHRRRMLAIAWVLIAALLAATVGTSVALAATPIGHVATQKTAASETLSDLEGVAGEFNATTCAQVDSSTAYSISLVTTGNDSPYCQVVLPKKLRDLPVATATSSLAYSGFSVVIQADTFPDLDFQVWNAGSNITGQGGAGYVQFIAAKSTP